MKLDPSVPAPTNTTSAPPALPLRFLLLSARVLLGLLVFMPATLLIAVALCLLVAAQASWSLFLFLTGQKPPPPPAEPNQQPLWLREMAQHGVS
jgi:hypothetical protein